MHMNRLAMGNYWKVAHGQAVMMAHASSLLGVMVVVAFKNWDYSGG